MRVLVCGGRDYRDGLRVDSYLNGLNREHGIDLVIQGGASGADELARQYCVVANVPCQTFAADWKKHGPTAGPIRNARMLAEGKPALVVAFPGGRGTEDMVRRAEAAGVKVIRVEAGARP